MIDYNTCLTIGLIALLVACCLPLFPNPTPPEWKPGPPRPIERRADLIRVVYVALPEREDDQDG